MLELTKNNFEKEINGDKPVVVDFWASWCGPCKLMGPVFEKISGEISSAKFAKVNVEDNQDLAQDYSVRGIPCVLVFSKGKEIDRWTGFMPEEDFKKRVEEALKKV